MVISTSRCLWCVISIQLMSFLQNSHVCGPKLPGLSSVPRSVIFYFYSIRSLLFNSNQADRAKIFIDAVTAAYGLNLPCVKVIAILEMNQMGRYYYDPKWPTHNHLNYGSCWYRFPLHCVGCWGYGSSADFCLLVGF